MFAHERAKDQRAESFTLSLTDLARQAYLLGLTDYAGVLDALADGAPLRLNTVTVPLIDRPIALVPTGGDPA